MIDLMIADDDLYFAKKLSLLLAQEKDFRVVSITTDGLQTLMDYSSLKPDVLLLDLNMPYLNGYQVLDTLSKNPTEKDKKNVIIISGDNDARASLRNTRKVIWMMNKDFNQELLFEIIREIKSDSKINDLQKDIDDLFNELKFDSTLKGTLLLKRSVYLTYTEPVKYSKTDDLITDVAEEFNYHAVISARSTMDKALSQMLKIHNDTNFLSDIFDDFYGYMSVKHLIRYSVNYLRDKYR